MTPGQKAHCRCLEGKAMKCQHCGGPMRTRRENFLYEAWGLREITLVGVEVSRCRRCGEHQANIPRLEQLHRAIAQSLARKPQRLTGSEIRYLRKWLGWSGAEFAARMGVRAETVSRWETARAPMGPAAERLLRLIVLTRQPIADDPLDVLTRIAPGRAVPMRLGMKPDKKGWHAVAA